MVTFSASADTIVNNNRNILFLATFLEGNCSILIYFYFFLETFTAENLIRLLPCEFNTCKKFEN